MQRGEIARPDGSNNTVRAQFVKRIADRCLGTFLAVALPPQVAADDVADADRSRICIKMLGQRPGKRDQFTGLLVECSKIAAAVLAIAAHHICDPVADLVISKAVFPGIHGLLILQDGRDQRVVVRLQPAEIQPLGFHFILLHKGPPLKRCGECRTVPICCVFFILCRKYGRLRRPGRVRCSHGR